MEQEISVSSVKREQYWQEQMAAWKASGLKQMQYCREHQLSKHAFVYWKLKLLGKDSGPATLVPVSSHQLRQIQRGDGSAQIRLVIGERYHVEVRPGFNAQTLQEVLGVLERLA
jgi:transposase